MQGVVTAHAKSGLVPGIPLPGLWGSLEEERRAPLGAQPIHHWF